MTSTLRKESALVLAYSFPPTIGDTKMSTILADHDGWLKCDGRSLSKNDFKLLFDVIGYTFGGSGLNFNLPDGRGRVTAAIGPDGNGISGDQVWVQGAIAGTQRETIDICEMPSHTHDISTAYTDVTVNNATTGITINSAGAQATMTSTDGDHTHTISDGGHTHGITDPGHIHIAAHTGGDVPINIMQPTIFIGNTFIYGGRPQIRSGIRYPSHRVFYT